MAYTTINKPSEYFNTKLYTGNGSSGNAQTGIGFQPDWVWIKDRGQIAGHQIFDSVRGATKRIQSNNISAEVTNDGVSSFDSDGFTLGANSSCNENSQNFVAWNWLGGGTGVSNTNGSIPSTVSANTTSGFSIVKWSGTSSNGTIGHGLGVAPKVIICFGYSSGTNSWTVGHNSLSWNNGIYLETGAAFSLATLWQNTAPTNNVFSVGSFSGTNSSQSMIAYCFAEKKGFSKFGSYSGNGNIDSPFIYTGFKPSYVLIKNASNIASWVILDNKRSPFNSADDVIRVNSDSAEAVDTTYADTDFLSNGFKLRTSDAWFNTTGETYIYMAFAENPLVGTNGVPATAR